MAMLNFNLLQLAKEERGNNTAPDAGSTPGLLHLFVVCCLLVCLSTGCATKAKGFPIEPDALAKVKTMAIVCHIHDKLSVCHTKYQVLALKTTRVDVPLVGWDFPAAFRAKVKEELERTERPFDVCAGDDFASMIFPIIRDKKGYAISRDYSKLRELGVDTVLAFAGKPITVFRPGDWNANTDGEVRYWHSDEDLRGTRLHVSSFIRLVDTATNTVLAEYNTFSEARGVGSFESLERNGLEGLKSELMRCTAMLVQKAQPNLGLAQ